MDRKETHALSLFRINYSYRDFRNKFNIFDLSSKIKAVSTEQVRILFSVLSLRNKGCKKKLCKSVMIPSLVI